MEGNKENGGGLNLYNISWVYCRWERFVKLDFIKMCAMILLFLPNFLGE